MDYLEEFAKAALLQDEAMKMGNVKQTDKYGFKMHEIARKLYLENQIGELRFLLNHSEDVVKGNAAIELLPFYPAEAETILLELSTKRGKAIYTNAFYTLKEWRKGNLKFDYYKK